MPGSAGDNANATARGSILVVDDDERYRTRLARALTERGYDVIEAADADSALTALPPGHVRPRYAVVDLRMPGTNGLDLVPQLRDRRPDLRIVILTGYGSIPTATEAIRRGAREYLTKPADVDEILFALGIRPDEDAAGADQADSAPTLAVPSLARVEWEHLQRVLNRVDGNISRAARELGIHRRSLQRKLAKLPPRE
jgi:two-component system response regulator RegA